MPSSRLCCWRQNGASEARNACPGQYVSSDKYQACNNVGSPSVLRPYPTPHCWQHGGSRGACLQSSPAFLPSALSLSICSQSGSNKQGAAVLSNTADVFHCGSSLERVGIVGGQLVSNSPLTSSPAVTHPAAQPGCTRQDCPHRRSRSWHPELLHHRRHHRRRRMCRCRCWSSVPGWGCHYPQ